MCGKAMPLPETNTLNHYTFFPSLHSTCERHLFYYPFSHPKDLYYEINAHLLDRCNLMDGLKEIMDGFATFPYPSYTTQGGHYAC